jgi:hypothetical protein
LRAVRLTVIWSPGQAEPSSDDLRPLDSAVAAARQSGTRLLFQVRPWGGKTAPSTPAGRVQFAAYAAALARRYPSVRDFVVGNEPNANPSGCRSSTVAAGARRRERTSRCSLRRTTR